MKPTDEQVVYIERETRRLPPRIGIAVRQLRRPGSAWSRVIVTIPLMLGGLLWFFPLLGFCMFPLGMLLIADQLFHRNCPAVERPVLPMTL